MNKNQIKRMLRRRAIPPEVMKKIRPLMEDLNLRYKTKKWVEVMLEDAARHPGNFTKEDVAVAEVLLDFVKFLEAESN